MSRRKDKRTPQQRHRDQLKLKLASAIAVLLSTVIQEILKERKP